MAIIPIPAQHDVRQFCKQHGIGAADEALIIFLVRQHLTMSTVAQKKDLSSPRK